MTASESMAAEQNVLTNSALRLLARREYSRGELRERLQRRSSNFELIEQVLDALAEQGLQSDERFTENFVRYRTEQGKGPIKIRQDLRQKQIDDKHIEGFLVQDESFWVTKAESVYQRKFGEGAPEGEKEFAKRIRFMVSRGFSAQTAYSLIEQHR